MTILGKEIKATNKGREGEGGTPIAPRYAADRTVTVSARA
jgi:hypothetical protein